jgi:hypothetical protein
MSIRTATQAEPVGPFPVKGLREADLSNRLEKQNSDKQQSELVRQRCATALTCGQTLKKLPPITAPASESL